MIKSKKSLGVQKVVQVEMNQKSTKSYVNSDGVISHNCKFCRRFYGDIGEIPKIYKLSTLIGNGSNYGKKQPEWKPVVGATHPNTRTSQILDIPPGYRLSEGGMLVWMGMEGWEDWIFEHLAG